MSGEPSRPAIWPQAPCRTLRDPDGRLRGQKSWIVRAELRERGILARPVSVSNRGNPRGLIAYVVSHSGNDGGRWRTWVMPEVDGRHVVPDPDLRAACAEIAEKYRLRVLDDESRTAEIVLEWPGADD